MPKWIEGTVVAQKAWTERLFSLQVDCGIGSFDAGQFARVALPVAGELVARPYSFVNAPRETPCEFYYNIVPEGPLSPRLVRLEPMDVVFLAPVPVVEAREPGLEDLLLLALQVEVLVRQHAQREVAVVVGDPHDAAAAAERDRERHDPQAHHQ